MQGNILEDMKAYIGFGVEDLAQLRALGPLIRPAFPIVLTRFYEEILRTPGTRQVLAGGEEQVERLKATLRRWLGELFDGEFGSDHFKQRGEIGRTHARIQLPQHYMITGMEVLRQELCRAAVAAGVSADDPKLNSLQKALCLELGIMLESYKENYASSVREKERNLVKDRLTRAEHLAEIGSLAASIAHEVKNPLAGISGAIQVMRKGMNPDDPKRPIIAEILGQIDRLDSAVKDLLLYARPIPPSVKSCDLNDVILAVLKILREEPAMRSVSVEYAAKDDLPRVDADTQQIEQVLMNLLLNAAQASGDGDAVSLTIDWTDRLVRLVVKDRGSGIAQDVSGRIFEPFFTTKAKGTGLGLPICRKIIDAHGGDIFIESSLGVGTTVTVEIPRHRP